MVFSMTDLKFFQAFDEWWTSQDDRIPTKRARDNARSAFLAGCRVATEVQDYRFRAGRWVVTVKAATLNEARKEAVRVLDRRASKLGAETPAHGWPLMQVAT